MDLFLRTEDTQVLSLMILDEDFVLERMILPFENKTSNIVHLYSSVSPGPEWISGAPV